MPNLMYAFLEYRYSTKYPAIRSQVNFNMFINSNIQAHFKHFMTIFSTYNHFRVHSHFNFFVDTDLLC